MSSPSDNVTAPAAVLTVPALLWANFIHLRTLAAAAAKEAEAARVDLNLPDAAELAESLGVDQDTPRPGVIVIQDGNGRPVGKVAVTYRNGYVVKGAWIARLS